MSVLRQRLADLLGASDVEPLAFWLGAVTLLWGLVLLDPAVDTFGGASPSWVRLGALAPEWVWGLVFALVGLAKMYAVLAAARLWMRLSSAAGFVLWFVVAVQFGLANPSGTGWVTTAAAAVGSAWVYLRASGALR